MSATNRRTELALIEKNRRVFYTLSSEKKLLIGRTDAEEDSSTIIQLDSGNPESDHYRSGVATISQKHAALKLGDDGLVIVKDLGSTNGTWIRLTPFAEHVLPAGTDVLLGQELVLQTSDPPLGESIPATEVGQLKHAEDLAGYLRSKLRHWVATIEVEDGTAAERPRGMYTRLPLLAEHKYLVVRWARVTFDLNAERWLRTVVTLFNGASARDNAEQRSWEFVAGSPGRRQALELARRLAPSSANVLLTGPSGVGKDVLARDLHAHSSRARGPYIPINCAALNPSLIESELFGVCAGAFTGAISRPGLFEQANGGTLFIDEIGELPLAQQTSLLRILEGRKVRRLGDKVERSVDVRIIAATNRNLHQLVAEHQFRDDLYHRLSTVVIEIPSLQPQDVQRLLPVLCSELAKDGCPSISAAEQEELSQLAVQEAWPGGARQLRARLHRFSMFRDPSHPVSETWILSGSMDPTGGGSELRVVPQSPHAGTELEPATEIPAGIFEAIRHLDSLVFLTMARSTLFPWKWGAVAELGRKAGMTGAGAAARLQKLGIPWDPPPTPEIFDAHLDKFRTALQPYLPSLRNILGAADSPS